VAGGALKPIGGHILSHSSATRMFLRKGKSLTPTTVIQEEFGAKCKPYLNYLPDFQGGLKNVLRSWWIAPTALRARPLTSWTKADGLTYDHRAR